MNWSHGNFHWNELMTHDVQRAKTFYEDAVGWTFDPMEMPFGTYWVAKGAEEAVGGMVEMTGPQFEGVPDHWMAYLAVDDVDARFHKATSHGASVIRAPFDIPGVGRIAILNEPGGAVIGMMTPSS